MLAPIALFVYNRPFTLQKTLDALLKNELAKESTIIIYCDGPKPNASREDLQKIEDVRRIVNNIEGFKQKIIKASSENKGLANSIINGVTECVNEYGKVIVLEDDLITSPFFLNYMNEALEKYNNESKVLSIGACNFWANSKQIPEYFFMPQPDCYGWATWKDRWDLFETDASKLLNWINENKE